MQFAFKAWIAALALASEPAHGQAQPALRATITPAQTLELKWSTVPGCRYELEETAELQTWQKRHSFTAGSLDASFSFPLATGSRFYRLSEIRPIPAWQTAFFSLPGPDGATPDYSLEQQVSAMLAAAPPGSTVRASIYTWDREEMVAPFAAAAARGVDVRIICGSDSPAIAALSAALPGRITICRNAAGEPVGSNGGRINHNKFYLFSALTDGSADIVVQTSANLTDYQLIHANNMVVIRNDSALYQGYLNYWNDLAAHPGNLNYFRTTASPAGLEASFFPRGIANGTTGALDPVVQNLSQIDPAAGGTIHVAMAFWTGPRRAIAERLVSLHRAGVQVSVLVDSEDTSSTIVSILRSGGVPLKRFPQLHSKYMLIDATVLGQRRRVVLTGSHNYTGPALTENDETLLRLLNPEIYDSFRADWDQIRAHPLITD